MSKLKGLTCHNNAKKGEIAKIVLMPGDPLRAKMIAETYFKDYKMVNDVRGMLAYTGKYKNKEVSVMASGMGMASAGIYSYELFKFYDVETIIRIGTTGSFDPEIKVGDLILTSKAVTGSTFAYEMGVGDQKEAYPSLELNNKIKENAIKKNIKIIEGLVHCSDNFYKLGKEAQERPWKERKAITAEMESFAIFLNAQILNKKAACILTVSDSITTDQAQMTTEERQNKLTDMIHLALDATV